MKDDIIYCLKCTEDILSFQRITNQQLFGTSAKCITNDIRSSNVPRNPTEYLKSLFKRINEINQSKTIKDDDNISEINCNYVDIDSFNYTHKKGFHAISFKHSITVKAQRRTRHNFDYAGLSISYLGKTEIIKNKPTIYDMNINGYKHYSTPTESTKGGTLQ